MPIILPERSPNPWATAPESSQNARKILLAMGAPGRERIVFNERVGCEPPRTKTRHGSRRNQVEELRRAGHDSGTMEDLKLRVFYLKKKIIFPFCSLVVFLRPSEDSREIKKGDRLIALTIRSTLDLLFHRKRIATLCEVVDVEIDATMAKIMLRGIERVRIEKIIKRKHAIYTLLDQDQVEHHDPFIDELRKKSQELVFLINVDESDRLIKMLNYIVDLDQMTDFISNYFIMDFGKRYRIYREVELDKRSTLLKATLTQLIHSMNTRGKKKTA